MDNIDGSCPNYHYSKAVSGQSRELKGHSLLCYMGTECKSRLRILRSAATHYPILRSLIRAVYVAINSLRSVSKLDEALKSGDFAFLMNNLDGDFDSLLSNDVETTHELTETAHSVLRRRDLELHLQITHAGLIAEYQKAVEDYPQNPCCSCQQLHQRRNVTKINFSNRLGDTVWPALKQFMLRDNKQAADETHFMCNYCKSSMKHDKMPPRCVLNGLEVIPIPEELKNLDCLSKQFIQRAKSYQTVVRLGTYTNKVPTYNSLQACKGTMFFLPLPLGKTLETLDQVNHPVTSLASPELYIIVNGKPTTNKMVWRSLVNVKDIKGAVEKLRQINWLYKDVDDSSLDTTLKEVVEVVSNASSTMLEKASDNDISGLQCYTIRNLNNKLNTDSDIEQYKLLHVEEEPLDNRQKFLDVMCFPTLFPDGKFGKYHPRSVKISHSEYIKSRLFNKDPRFRKEPRYIFYLLWQKEMREISAGVYNILKSSKSHSMTVGNLLDKVGANDEHLESNLSTMLQSVRGTKQYWYVRQSDLRCMVREYGSPTLFLTFSCAEYESYDIVSYLRSLNDVSDSYNIGKLCTEDPVSVSRQFSHKFHAFFQKVLIKGEVLGCVDHYFWKKEYQARGAPHFHVLLWIRDAPVIGKDDPDKILAWIQERITCHIPEKESNPELNSLVTRYQMHKCSAYCRRRVKRGSIYTTTCKFNFPREPCENAVLHCVEEKLKKHQKIYQLPRTESETRVNDYNPLLLLLWKANIDIQFVAESSLALSYYVTAYVTKAERSTLQEVWNEVSDNKSVYSRLWSFGVRALRSRECGLYEASDLLIGDHLCEKSTTVKWICVKMPHKRSRRLKNHSVLQEIADENPESEDIFEDDLFNTHYPKRPADLEDVCLHDFVANYDWYSKDRNGDRIYRRLTKPRLVNHKLYDPNKEEEREDFYYSLVLLFVPFRNEASLLQENEKPEEAFNRLLPSNESCSEYHSRLQKILKAREALKKINDAREANNDNEGTNKEDHDEPELLGQAKSAMLDALHMNAKKPDKLTLQERVMMLNSDQRRIFERVKDHLLHQVQHEADECNCEFEPLCMFISGVGGTGKSFLIEALKQLIDGIWTSDDLTCAVAAPTGLAAFNVGGVTIHRLFQLPIEHEGKEAGYWSLSKASQKIMKTVLRGLKMIIVDEVSMVSSLNLAYMHLRLEELFGGHSWFGGKNVIFVGDLLQLQPVNGSPVFEMISKKSLCHKLGCTTSVNIWKSSIKYDELTINERQKKDREFSQMLDSVRRGSPTEETLCTLQERVTDRSVPELFRDLKNSDMNPVCLFPTREQCDQVNNEMLGSLDSEIYKISCTDEVDETKSKSKWNKKAAEKLEKLNKDCNNTAGLEAVLKLAVGARVMLRRNIDIETGLVNGAIGTVIAISARCISVQFDHINDPCDIEKVKTKFMVMKNYFVYREQFPLILAYAVTIHKCQGLSLDCAIIDLSSKVFADGMAYVALSRVKSLLGLHLISLDKDSIRVNRKSIMEINRLREMYRKDLPLYDVPAPRTRSKRKLTGTSEQIEPNAKKRRVDNPIKANPINSQLEQRVWPFKFHSVDEQWQRNACASLGLQFERSNGASPGSGSLPLTCPDKNKIKTIVGDGNCMFRSLSYIITGSQAQHGRLRTKIIQHMHDIAPLIIGHIRGRSQDRYTTVGEYIQGSGMDKTGVWGTDIELLTLAHLLKTCIFSYDTQRDTWDRFKPSSIDKTVKTDLASSSLYLRHPQAHYEVVLAVEPLINSNPPQSNEPDEKKADHSSGNSIPTSNHIDGNIILQEEWPECRFHSVDEEWQKVACGVLNIPYHCKNGLSRGGANVILTRPDKMQKIIADGNCLFRCLSHIVTGTQRHHVAVRLAIIEHLQRIPGFLGTYGYKSVNDYLNRTNMDKINTWGTDIEMFAFAHLLNTPIYSFVKNLNDWHKYPPSRINLTMYDDVTCDDVTQKAMYIRFHSEHFEVVCSVL